MSGERDLTSGEWAALSPGLADALHRAGVRPRLVGRASGLARIAALWRGQVPVMALGRRIFWPHAPDDLSAPGRERLMAILQHELQHLLEYAEGRLSVWCYAIDPHNWTYRYRLDEATCWSRLGAEQRASVVEELWLLEHAASPAAERLRHCRRVIPWASPDEPDLLAQG